MEEEDRETREEGKAERKRTGTRLCDECCSRLEPLVEYTRSYYYDANLLCTICLDRAKKKEVKETDIAKEIEKQPWPRCQDCGRKYSREFWRLCPYCGGEDDNK